LDIYNKKYSSLLAKLDHLQAFNSKNSLEKTTILNIRKGYKMNTFSASSYQKAKELIEQSAVDFKERNYSSVLAKTFIGLEYLKEVW
jgi:hypothetical protein